MSAQEHDPVHHPKHYTAHPSGVECIELAQDLPFCLGNALKYVFRAGLKTNDASEDCAKAAWYLNRHLISSGSFTFGPFGIDEIKAQRVLVHEADTALGALLTFLIKPSGESFERALASLEATP